MLTLVTGKQLSALMRCRLFSDDGFALIEILVAIGIMAIVLSVAMLNIPNHDERYWRNDLDHMVASLNAAQDESAMSGNLMLVQIDAQGWRFQAGTTVSVQGISLGSGDARVKSSVLMPDVYRAQLWNKAVIVEPMQLTLGGEYVVEALTIPIAQDARRAVVSRNRYGRYTWARA